MTISNEPRTGRTYPSGVTPAEIDEALAVDAKLQAILTDGPSRPMRTEQSIREGEAHVEQGRRNAVITLLERIARKELITEDELRKMLGVSRKWVTDAVTTNRLFRMQTPAGEDFYPAFYGNPYYGQQSLAMVCQKLGDLPGASKFHFFTSKSTYLGIKTPLEALKDGMLDKALTAAQGFVER